MSGGVRRVSRWCLIDPGYCQDCIDGIPDGQKKISLYSTTAFPIRKFLPMPFTIQTVGLSGRCLKGVWKVSGGC